MLLHYAGAFLILPIFKISLLFYNFKLIIFCTFDCNFKSLFDERNHKKIAPRKYQKTSKIEIQSYPEANPKHQSHLEQ